MPGTITSNRSTAPVPKPTKVCRNAPGFSTDIVKFGYPDVGKLNSASLTSSDVDIFNVFSETIALTKNCVPVVNEPNPLPLNVTASPALNVIDLFDANVNMLVNELLEVTE